MPFDKGIKILLADDAKFTRIMELKLLKEIGFTNFVEAEDGQDAMNKLAEIDDVGLIISDWNMPNKDGYDPLVWVRANARYQTTPFIMATARGEMSHIEKATAAGVNEVISKPFTREELEAVIEKVMSGGEAAKEPEKPVRERTTASGKLRLTVGHIQITDHLVLGVAKHLIANEVVTPRYFELETQCMPSWNPVQHALQKGDVDAALVLAPIAMDLFSVNVPIRMVLLAHRNGSICVRSTKTDGDAMMFDFFLNKRFFIPHILSIHHMLATMYLREMGFNPGVAGTGKPNILFEVVPPVKMPEFLRDSEDACGFMVAEPVGSRAIAMGIGEKLFLSSELWDNHPCCIVAARDEIIGKYPDALHEFTELLVDAGKFIEQEPDTAAQIAVNFLDPAGTLGLKAPVLHRVLTDPMGIMTGDLLPNVEDFDRIQRYMHDEMGVGALIDVEKFIDLRFAASACGRK